jgi:hypothetical protein
MVAYQYHVDPGHGWVGVPYLELIRLGIVKAVSRCSYRDADDTCYLEEDCDMPLWEQAYEQHYGRKPVIETVYHDRKGDPPCFIHDLPAYTP